MWEQHGHADFEKCNIRTAGAKHPMVGIVSSPVTYGPLLADGIGCRTVSAIALIEPGSPLTRCVFQQSIVRSIIWQYVSRGLGNVEGHG